MNSIKVSIIIVSWNTRDILRDCLKSIFEQTRNFGFEVIVVDNASHDRTADMVREEFPKVLLIANSENRGFAAANNQGLKVAKGDYLLLLNPDTIILDRAIEKTADYADAHPDVGVVGCRVLRDPENIQRTCFSFPSPLNLFFEETGLLSLFPRSSLFGRSNLGWWDRDTEREVDVVSGMYMLVRKQAMEEVGLMDEDYFVYAEETDWCYRFWKAGWKCVFTPVAQIIHLDGGTKSTSQVSVKMYVQLQKSLLIFHYKNLGYGSYVLSKLLFIIGMIMRGVTWQTLSLLGLGKASKKKAMQSWAALKFHLFRIEPA